MDKEFKRRVALLAAQMMAAQARKFNPNLTDEQFEAKIKQLMPEAVKDARQILQAVDEYLCG